MELMVHRLSSLSDLIPLNARYEYYGEEIHDL